MPHGVTNPEVKAQLAAARDKFAMPPAAIARAIAFAIEQPAIDVKTRSSSVPPRSFAGYTAAERLGMV